VKSVILDENIPRRLGSRLLGHRVTTVAEQGWGGVKNGRLMALIDGSYDVFVTADKNLRYQQNLAGRKISIIEVPFNDSAKLLPRQRALSNFAPSCRNSATAIRSVASAIPWHGSARRVKMCRARSRR
jgi:hypothetical protein